MFEKNVISVCDPHVHIENNKDWFDVIANDDPDGIKEIMTDNARAKQLVSGHFEYGDVALRQQVSAGPCSSVQLPLAVAAVRGASHSIKALLHAGVSPKQLDCHGNNVLHSLVAYLHYHSAREEAIVAGSLQLLLDTVSVHVLREMLQHENAFGLRPLEFAAQHGQGSMVLAILNTPGVYLSKQQVVGLTCYKWYNITEYESTGSRRQKSPLLLMTYVDKAAAATSGFSAFMDSSLAQAWLAKKFWMNLPLLIMWGIMRFIFITLYMLTSLDMSMDSSGRNGTVCMPDDALIMGPGVLKSMVAYLVFVIAISLLLDVYDSVQVLLPHSRCLHHMISGRKKHSLQTTIYRVSHFALCVFILICSPMMFGHPNEMAESLASYSQIVNPVLAAWSFMYFVQLVPSLGFYVISVYSMIKDLGSLFILYMLMIIPFTQAFYTFLNTNTLQGCIAGFSSVLETMYSIFLIMLNMVSLTEFSTKDQELLYVTHMLYTFCISILLINFFIAVMSDTMSTLSARKAHILAIQKSSMAFTVEGYVLWLLKPFYVFMTKKLFVVDGDDVMIVDAVSK